MLWIVLTLILVGLLLLLLEVLVIPGSGITGIIGFISIIAGIWLGYSDLGTKTGTIILVATLVVNGFAVWLTMRYKTWKKVALSAKIDGKVNNIEKLNLQTGDKGVAISRCAPMGKAEIKGSFVEVNAGTEFIDQGKTIEITKIDGNKIFVKLIK